VLWRELDQRCAVGDGFAPLGSLAMRRDDASALDAVDPLRASRDRFVIDDPELIYLDGNSLGRLPRTAMDAIGATVSSEWGAGLVRSWHEWIDLPTRIGDQIAPLVGAKAGEVLVCDQTSVNLYKLATAALVATGRRDIVTDDANFPSDRYILEQVASAAGGQCRVAATHPIRGVQSDDIVAHLDASVGVVSLSHVAYKSGALADMKAISSVADAAGAFTLWDLSHSAGAVPVDLNGSMATLAVGCTYKHLNGGPGAPAFLYVRSDLHDRMRSPIPGWFGHQDLFGFEPEYRPAGGVRRFAAGTPPIVSLRGVEHGVAITTDAGLHAIRAKSIALTDLLIERFDARLGDLGWSLATPRNPEERGSHVAIRHPDAYRVTQALIDRGVVPDFRSPDTIRLGVAALYTTYTEVYDAVEHIADIVQSEAHKEYPETRGAVT